MFLKNRNISSKIRRSKVTDYAALNSLLYETGWETLSQRRTNTKKKLTLMFKIINNEAPNYRRNLLPYNTLLAEK